MKWQIIELYYYIYCTLSIEHDICTYRCLYSHIPNRELHTHSLFNINYYTTQKSKEVQKYCMKLWRQPLVQIALIFWLEVILVSCTCFIATLSSPLGHYQTLSFVQVLVILVLLLEYFYSSLESLLLCPLTKYMLKRPPNDQNL